MPFGTILTIIIYILIIIIIFKFVKKIAKAFFYIGLITFLILLISGFFIYRDFIDIKKNFQSSEKVAILIDNNEVLAGFIAGEKIGFLDEDKIGQYSNFLKDKEYDKILGSRYKLLIVNINAIDDIEKEKISLGEKEITKDFAVSVLKAQDPFQLLAKENIMEHDILSEVDSEESIGTDKAKVKAVLFGIMFSEGIIKDPLLFLKEYKDENIIIYPETAIFKAVKLVPFGLIKSVFDKVISKAKEKAQTLENP